MTKTRVPLTSGDARRVKARFGANPRTTAIPLVPYDTYGGEDWLMARRGLVGASEIAAVMGFSPYASPFSLWWSKQDGWDLDQTLAMWIGHELEPLIAKVFAHERPDLVIARADGALWTHPDAPWIGCSPDYLAIGQDHTNCHDRPEPCECPVGIEPVECKSDVGGPEWGKPGTDEVPRHHKAQLWLQCHIFGAKRGHLVRMFGKRFASYTVDYDATARATVALWIEAARSFMTSLELGIAPDVDDHTATTDALERLYPAVDDEADVMVPDDEAAEWELAGEALKAAKARKRKADNVVRERLGKARYGCHAGTGRRFVDRRTFKHPGCEIPPHEVDGLWPVRSGAKHAKVVDA